MLQSRNPGDNRIQWETALAEVIPTRAHPAIQGELSQNASSSKAPLRGWLMKITWDTLRSPGAQGPWMACARSSQPLGSIGFGAGNSVCSLS